MTVLTRACRAAAFVFALSLAGPMPAMAIVPRGEPSGCQLSVPSHAAQLGGGTVVGFERHDISVARVASTEKTIGGHIDPAYADTLRTMVSLDSGRTLVFVAPVEMQVRLGDRVTVQGLAQSAGQPCGYVPPLIVTDLGQPHQNSVEPATDAAVWVWHR
jgi:hypothetical protein